MKAKEIKKLTKDQLHKNLDKFKKDLFNLRFRKINGQLTNPAKFNETKKLIIKNSNLVTEKKNYFFNKSELKIILNLYAKMVSKGFWKDYGLNISKEEVSFNVYKRTSENAAFRICKNFRLKNKNLKYSTSDSQGNILNISKNLEELLNKTRWKNSKLVN